MTSKVSDFLKEQAKEVVSYRQILTKESDRGCALFAAAYLDTRLSDLLYVYLVENKQIEGDLFAGTAPLSTFSSRIKMAYYLGLISEASRRELDIIRRIRNDFAHKVADLSFDEPPMSDRCKSLAMSYHETTESPRNHFTASSAYLLGLVLRATLSTPALKPHPDDSPSLEKKKQLREQIAEVTSAVRATHKDEEE